MVGRGGHTRHISGRGLSESGKGKRIDVRRRSQIIILCSKYSIWFLALYHNISLFGNNISLSPNTNRVVVRRGPGCRGVAASRSVKVTFVNHFGSIYLFNWTPQNHSYRLSQDSFGNKFAVISWWPFYTCPRNLFLDSHRHSMGERSDRANSAGQKIQN